jgi:ERF superfamily.
MTESTLTKIQNELKAPKGQHNKFGNYDYRSAEDILEALKPLLAKHNAQLTLTDKPVMVGEWHYIEATARLVVDGNEIANTASARESAVKKGMDDSQITGTASSYARKYALNGLFLIDDTKDADTNEYVKSTRRTTTRGTKQYSSTKKENALEQLKVVYAPSM